MFKILKVLLALLALAAVNGCAMNGQYMGSVGYYNPKTGGAAIQIDLPFLVTTPGCNTWRCQHGANVGRIEDETARANAVELEGNSIYWQSRNAVYWDNNTKAHRHRIDCGKYVRPNTSYYYKRCLDGFEDGKPDSTARELADRAFRDQGDFDKGRLLVR